MIIAHAYSHEADRRAHIAVLSTPPTPTPLYPTTADETTPLSRQAAGGRGCSAGAPIHLEETCDSSARPER